MGRRARGSRSHVREFRLKVTPDNILSVLDLLNLALKRPYPTADMAIITDYDLCPGESFVRVTTRVRFEGEGLPREMPELDGPARLIDLLVGEHSGVDCERQSCPPEAPQCDDLLIDLTFGSLKTTMKRCRGPQDRLAGVFSGDYMFFSAKSDIFVPGSGFDFDSAIRAVFDTGGDIFASPLSIDYLASVGDGVSYAYFNQGGKMTVPVFGAAFTVAISNRLACPREDPNCFSGEELVFRRFVAVGNGDVASALASFYQIRGIKTGAIQGHVIAADSRLPISAADVFVFRTPQIWQDLPLEQLAQKSYRQLVDANRAETRSVRNPAGLTGLVSHFKTDTGFDQRRDGSFSGQLPAGTFVLMFQDEQRGPSSLVPLKVRPGQSYQLTLIAPVGGLIDYRIVDETGKQIPLKLTFGHCMPECAVEADCGASEVCDAELQICRPTAGYAGAEQCRPDQYWDAAVKTCRCGSAGAVPLELGGARYADGVIRTVMTSSGQGRVTLPSGSYQVIASRGIEYELFKAFITVAPANPAQFSGVLRRAVQTPNWIAADFHVHGPNSVDSGLSHEQRVLSYAAEGIELLTATDHDHLTDYQPTIKRLRLTPWLTSQTGLEVSTLDYGHFIGFPLQFDDEAELNGGFHWRRDVRGAAAPDWENIPPGAIYRRLRNISSVEEPVIFVAHFYDHLAFFGIDPWDARAAGV